jgi:hypothetical protein
MARRSATTAFVQPLAAALAVLWLGSVPAAEQTERELGMNVIGNNETPRALVIVPWKSADPGDLTLHPVQSLIDVPLVPLDRDVVLRELHYRQRTQAVR